MFASRSLLIHLGRGAVGFGALVASVLLGEDHPALALSLLPVAFIALRGCPMCWTVGLIETIVASLRGKRVPNACLDGNCSIKP